MSLKDFHNVQKGSIILIVGLFLCLCWRFVEHIPFAFLFFNTREGLNLSHVLPYIVAFYKPISYIVVFKLVGTRMYMPYLGDLWYYHLAFDAFLFGDFILANNQTIGRVYLVGVLMIIQVCYAYYSYKQIED